MPVRAVNVGARDRAAKVVDAVIRVALRPLDRREVCLVVADVLADFVAGLADDNLHLLKNLLLPSASDIVVRKPIHAAQATPVVRPPGRFPLMDLRVVVWSRPCPRPRPCRALRLSAREIVVRNPSAAGQGLNKNG